MEVAEYANRHSYSGEIHVRVAPEFIASIVKHGSPQGVVVVEDALPGDATYASSKWDWEFQCFILVFKSATVPVNEVEFRHPAFQSQI